MVARCERGLCHGRESSQVLALYLNQPGRTVFTVSSVFLSVALLQLAQEDAGCVDAAGEVIADCDKRVYGMRPSSVLSTMTSVGFLTTAFFMPYAGAVVDHTSRRREFGGAMASAYALVNVAQIALFRRTWFAMAVLQAVIAQAGFTSQSMAMWAYVNEAVDTDTFRQTVVSNMAAWQAVTILLYLGVMAAVIFGAGIAEDAVMTARAAQLLASVAGVALLARSWQLFAPRPARHGLSEGGASGLLWAAGVKQLWATISTMPTEQPDLFRFMVALVFSEAGIRSLFFLILTYLTTQLGLSGTNLNLFYFAAILTGLPGAVAHRVLYRRVGHKLNVMLIHAMWVAFIVAMVGLLRSPAQSELAVFFGLPFGARTARPATAAVRRRVPPHGCIAMMAARCPGARRAGFLLGINYPALNGYFAALTPPGREVEMWGWFLFASNALSWLHPILFTLVNELSGDQRLGLSLAVPFIVLAAAVFATITRARFDGVATDGVGASDAAALEAAAASAGASSTAAMPAAAPAARSESDAAGGGGSINKLRQ